MPRLKVLSVKPGKIRSGRFVATKTSKPARRTQNAKRELTPLERHKRLQSELAKINKLGTAALKRAAMRSYNDDEGPGWKEKVKRALREAVNDGYKVSDFTRK